jgi:GxxExxY protein
MGILISAAIRVFDQESFHGIDKLVRGIAFDVHNEYGRYLDERLYQAELGARFAHHKLGVVREMRMTLTLDNFSKEHYADFLLNGGVIVETKTADSLTGVHTAQVLNWCELLKTTLVRALEDWGARLDPIAYRDAVIHFLGGEAVVVKDVDIRSEHRVLGRQKVDLLRHDIAFSITASGRCPGTALDHQRRFLQHTDLQAIQWVNLNGQTVTFHTIRRP